MDTVTVTVEATSGSLFTTETPPAPARADVYSPLLYGCAVGEGWLEGSLDEDGEPADALVLLDEPALPGLTVPARPIALAHLTVDGTPNDTLLCVAADQARFDEITDIRTLESWHANETTLADVLQRFGPTHDWQVRGIDGPLAAEEFVSTARHNFERLTGSLG
ncbi:inorganic diphosphatase [Streptomyces sp. NPDC059398]|uniref:inorganic diphosphatase n=1 Tax=Streptomyces sp. NPDC059398 TaxID=3346820 RepID=UPI0036889F46